MFRVIIRRRLPPRIGTDIGANPYSPRFRQEGCLGIMRWSPPADALLLLITANLLPWAVGRVCGTRWNAPLDFGVSLSDGRRLLGDHKTWRGVAAAILGCATAAVLMQLHWWTGAAFGALSMLGDCFSSAWKRRRGHEPGRETFGLDQLPEALLPLLVLRVPLDLSWVEIAVVAATFAVLDIASTRVRHPRRRLHRVSE
jgi:hypothetical protein